MPILVKMATLWLLNKKARPKPSFQVIDLIGRSGEIRTRDPHNPIVVRYQAALRSDRSFAGFGMRHSNRFSCRMRDQSGSAANRFGSARLSVAGRPEPLPVRF